MPLYETKRVRVEVIVYADDHILTFEEIGEARGARYHGADPREKGYSTNDTLEKSIRGTVDTNLARATKKATAFLANAYPVIGDTR